MHCNKKQSQYDSLFNLLNFDERLTSPKVIIIGAGCSGVGAARTLLNSGISPIILEARDRIGGRIFQQLFAPNLVASQNFEFVDSTVAIQLGANWVHGLNETINPMYSVAQKLRLRMHQTSSDDEPGDDVCLYDIAGIENPGNSNACVQISREDYYHALERYFWITDNIDIDVDDHLDLPLSEAFKRAIVASEDPDLPFGPMTELDRKVLNWCLDRISIDSGLPIDQVSMRYYDDSASDGEYGEAVVQYYKIFEHLANEVSLDVRYQQIVTDITKLDNGGVLVTCSNGTIYKADACIVTVPIGVLKSGAISFNPRPPQLDRLCKLQAGLMNLVWLWYPTQFWPSGYNFFGMARNDDDPVTLSTFLVPPMFDQFGNKQPILMCQTFGEFAKKIETMSNEDVAKLATERLRKIFGHDKVPDAVGCIHSSWSREEFSRCSYSCISPVACHDQIRDFGVFDSGVEGIHFAGEATHQMHQGTAHGAYISGIREATKILDRFGISKSWAESVYLTVNE